MDFDSFFRNKVENMLITASWVEKVQKMLDLERISQVWGDRPEWYFWIKGTPGPYSLAFKEGETVEAGNQALLLGQFTVKCFPYVEATVFDAFSPQEREIVTSDLFDDTHTPRQETRKDIPEAFFTLGSISFLLDPAERVAMVTFDSLDRLKWSMVKTNMDQGNRSIDVQDVKVIRSLPGWQIGYPLFDRLIGLYAFYTRQAPAFIGATRSPGFEGIVDINQTPGNRVCDDSQQYSASVLFSTAADTHLLVDTIWRAHLESKEKIVYERVFRHQAHHPIEKNGHPQVMINPHWWELVHSNLKSELASTCGCVDHEPHTCGAECLR